MPPNQPPNPNRPNNNQPPPGYPPNQSPPQGQPPNQPPQGQPPNQPPPGYPPHGYPPNQPPQGYPPNQPPPGYPPSGSPNQGYSNPQAPYSPRAPKGSSGNKGLKIGLFVVGGLVLIGGVGFGLMFFFFLSNNIDGTLEEANITCKEIKRDKYIGDIVDRQYFSEDEEDEEDEYQKALEDELKGSFFECEDDDDREYQRLTAGDVKARLNIEKKFNADDWEKACEDDAKDTQKNREESFKNGSLQLKNWAFFGDDSDIEELEKALEKTGAEVKEVEFIQVCEEE